MTDLLQIRQYVVSYFDRKLPEQGLSLTFNDLPVDSLDLLDFVIGLEKQFGIELGIQDLRTSMTLEEFCAVVSKKTPRA
jgi:acyl carrier protein